jgi:hypothetical protein
LSGFLHTGALLHGLIPSVLTILATFFALKEFKNTPDRIFWHMIIVILPVITSFVTPAYMYVIQGPTEWLTKGRLPVLIIYECLAVFQFITAVIIRKLKENI